MSTEPLLAVEGAVKTFNAGTPDARLALDAVSLALLPAEFAIVIGGNGAGKSTLLGAVAGEVRIDRGSIRVVGKDLTRLPTHRRAPWIARVFQDPRVGTAGEMTVAENMALAERRGRRNRLRWGLTRGGRARYRDRLALLGHDLQDRMEQKVGLLSGGQRQSLALAMAVLTTPPLLLLDEHCAALDPKAAALVMQATVRAVAEDGISTLMVTHNMQHAIDYGDRLIMMMNGRIMFEATGDEKRHLTVDRLVERFHLASDRLVLA